MGMRWRLSGSGWHLAAGLVTLARQVNEVWPTRHAADGTLGNVSHSNVTSDHNPDKNGVVRALDIGEVVENDAMIVAEALRQSKDIRIKYVIHEKRMYSYYWKNGHRPFTWRPYSGANLHWNHVHISTRRSYDSDTRPWDIGRANSGGGEIDMANLQVVDLQKVLNKAGQKDSRGRALVEDDIMGANTRFAWVNGLTALASGHDDVARRLANTAVSAVETLRALLRRA